MTKSAVRVRSWGLIIAVPILLALQAFAPTPVVLMCLLAAAGLLIASFVWVWGLSKSVNSKYGRKRDWAQIGGMLEEEYAVNNSSWLPVPWAEIGGSIGLPNGDTRRVVGVPPRGTVCWTTQTLCTRRGIYNLGPTCMRLGDPFGLFEVTLARQDAQPFYVYPLLAAVPLLTRVQTMSHGYARSNQRSLVTTANITGTRPYAPGDPFNHIHWRSTAHHSTPEHEVILIKEFDPEPLADFWIVLDLDSYAHMGEGDRSTEEYAVRLAASLGYQMLRGHRAVGLIAQGAKPIILPQQRGPGQTELLMRILAGVHADGRLPLAEVLQTHVAMMRKGAHCALLTPSRDPSWSLELPQLLSRNVYATAFLLDGRPFGGTDGMQETAERLAILGITGHIVGREIYAQLDPLSAQGKGDGHQELHEGPGHHRAAPPEWTPVGQGQAT